jgi:hypothetical protein
VFTNGEKKDVRREGTRQVGDKTKAIVGTTHSPLLDIYIIKAIHHGISQPM